MKYRFNGCELSVGGRTISRDGCARHVEPQVFDLIRYLVENQARVVGKDELIARVWKGRIVSDATIASRINAARKAVGDDGRRQEVFATFSRLGFRCVAEVIVDDAGLGQPALAVLPFELQGSGDGHLARGLADQLAEALGQAGWFDVRDTAASFADGFVGQSLEEIARTLDADYLVAGGLQVSGRNLRISVRLVDPEGRRQLWSSSFTGERDEIFELQDRMAAEILGEVEPRLRRMELQRSARRHGSFTAFDHFLRAGDRLRAMDMAAMQAARTELEKALSENPDYAAAHGMHAWIGTLMVPQGRRVDVRKEAEHYRTALTLGSFDCSALTMGGYALGFFERDPTSGLGHLRRALAINPSAARAHDFAGWLLLYAGAPADALSHFDRALALCPVDEFAFRVLAGRAFARLFLSDFSASVADARRAHAAAPSFTVCHRVLAAALAHLGRTREARAIVKELLDIHRGLSLARYQKETRFDRAEDRKLLFGGLKLAGMA